MQVIKLNRLMTGRLTTRAYSSIGTTKSAHCPSAYPPKHKQQQLSRRTCMLLPTVDLLARHARKVPVRLGDVVGDLRNKGVDGCFARLLG